MLSTTIIIKSYPYLNKMILNFIKFKQILNRGRFQKGILNPNNNPVDFCGGFKLIHKSFDSFHTAMWDLCPRLLIMDLFNQSLVIRRVQQKQCHVISRLSQKRPCSFFGSLGIVSKGRRGAM